ncbi:DNA/RNA non-specific endonuclease [uncultured Jannaschia sp.]|uniref:DNA/RNA non-specific endonuclease n=1 Tax=uncultured Jannaschia sp. TaxID=293347 RepID=UPI002609009E|nr:DNA/RNA non-specific endonuclease [uncultured Jannaschia sp.]
MTAFDTTSPDALADRRGYDPAFLGDGAFRVDFPGLGPRTDDLAPVAGVSDAVLRYQNFSILQSRSRRLPILAAVNVDGGRAFDLPRRGRWRLDGRLAPEHQIGNELYRDNPLDRGHMVRRKDAGWGATRAEAERGEADTFHYTNAAPQHADLNQRDWLGLEDYILRAVTTRGLRASVLTGPVLADSDRPLDPRHGADGVAIPAAFWKVAAVVDDATGRLSATGYLLAQDDLIDDLVRPGFAFGGYGAYQVRLSRLSDLSGLDFSALDASDPMAERARFVPDAGIHRVDGPNSLLLGFDAR